MPSKAGDTKLPVLVWGNGACSADGRSNQQLLQQIASHGYLAISSGGPGQQGSTTAKMMTDSIDWAVANAGKGAYANVDASKIMAAGFSCGGVEAYAQIWDSRVSTVGIFSSGLLDNQTAATHFNKPILYVLGGQSDIAYANVCFLPPSPLLADLCMVLNRMLTRVEFSIGRERLQESPRQHPRMEGQHQRRSRRHSGRPERRQVRQGRPQLASVCLPR